MAAKPLTLEQLIVRDWTTGTPQKRASISNTVSILESIDRAKTVAEAPKKRRGRRPKTVVATAAQSTEN